MIILFPRVILSPFSRFIPFLLFFSFLCFLILLFFNNIELFVSQDDFRSAAQQTIEVTILGEEEKIFKLDLNKLKHYKPIKSKKSKIYPMVGFSFSSSPQTVFNCCFVGYC